MNEHSEQVDELTHIIYLEVPGSKVVLLQAIFELYEGVGTVRTLDIKRSLVCILTTPDMLPHCLMILDAIEPRILWRFAQRPSAEDRDRYLGYYRASPG